MNNEEILSCVDHTLLSPVSSWDEITQLCEEAIRYKTASVCVSPSYIKRIRETFPGLCICTVIGFPLGYNVTEAKAKEAKTAIFDGASELDMVVNLGGVKNGDFGGITREIAALKEIAGKNILKVIIETCYLTNDEKITLCKCVTDAGADYIKTSTGFGTGGATMEDVLLFREHIGRDVKIKAAGGIRTREDMVNFIEAGCARLGTSSAIKILSGETTGGY